MRGQLSGGPRWILLLAAILAVSLFFINRAKLGGLCSSGAQITVIARCGGLAAEDIERLITIPMETTFSELPGIRKISALSCFSTSRINLKLHNPDDMEKTAVELQEKTDRVYSAVKQLNPAAEKPLIVRSGSDQYPVFIAAFSRGTLSPGELRPLVESSIKPSFARIEGLGEIETAGGRTAEVHIETAPERAAARGYSCRNLAEIVRDANLFIPLGIITEGTLGLPISIDARINDIQSLKDIPLGGSVKLSDEAAVAVAFRKAEDISRLNGTERVSMHIKSSSNSLIPISKSLRAECEKWRARGYGVDIILDRGAELEKSFIRAAAALSAGMLISVLTLLPFKPGIRRLAALTAVQPVVMLTALGILSAAGLPFEHHLLAGLSIGTGMVLDSALILTAAIDAGGPRAARRIIPPLASSVGSTQIAMLPVFSLGSRAPEILPVVAALSAVLLVSLILSVIFIPRFYRPSVTLTVRTAAPQLRPRTALAVCAVLTAAGLLCLLSIPFRMTTLFESTVVRANLDLAAGECVSSADDKLGRITSAAGRHPAVQMIQSTARRSGGELSVVYDPAKAGRNEIIQFIRAAGAAVPDGFLYIPETNEDRLELDVTVTGPDLEVLKKTAGNAAALLLETDWAVEGVLHFRDDPPAVHFIPDRDIVSSAGLSTSGIAAFLQWNLQGPVADKLQLEFRETDLRIMAAGAGSMSRKDLEGLIIPAAENPGYRIGQLGYFEETTEPSCIRRANRQHAVSFSVICQKDDPLKLSRKIMEKLKDLPIPEGFSFIGPEGLAEKQEFQQNLRQLFILSMLLVFMLIAIERESPAQAVMIMLQLPVILAFPLISLKLLGREAGSETMLGLILLSGMGINNGILIMDNIERGITAAVQLRFSSLLLTTITSITGLLPLFFMNETFFTNIAIVLISGLAGSFVVSVKLFPGLLISVGYSADSDLIL